MWTIRASAAAAVVLLAVLTGCGSGDSTVAKTPDPTTTAETTPPASSPPPPTSTTPPPPDPCAVDLTAPAIARAIAELPKDPRSQQPWSPEPIAGNYNECAQLSAIIVKANTNSVNANTRAVLFHQGKYIPIGVPDTFGFNGIDTTQTNGDTVALKFTSAIGLDSIIKFHWNGNGVELIGNTPGS